MPTFGAVYAHQGFSPVLKSVSVLQNRVSFVNLMHDVTDRMKDNQTVVTSDAITGNANIAICELQASACMARLVKAKELSMDKKIASGYCTKAPDLTRG